MEQIEEKMIHKKVIFFVILFFLFFLTTILYSYFLGTKGLVIKEYKITNPKLPNSFYGFKIVHMSDIHYGRIIHKKELENIIFKINQLKPDIVVLTGDLLDQSQTLSDQDIQDMIASFQNINVTIGKFAILGEHDYNSEAWSTIMKESKFINLNDTYELIFQNGYEPILLAGLSTNLKGTKNAKDKIKPINDYITSIQESNSINTPKYKILLMHEPDFIDSISYQNYDLILAGHSHNGQVRIPFFGAIIKPSGSKKYYDNYYSLGSTDFYISSGLGTTKYDVRLWNHPSINFYRLVNK